MIFDHEKLDVYLVSVKFTAQTNLFCQKLSGQNRHLRDQLLRASQSIPLNIAEGNGKRSAADRKRFFEIARGSSFECCAVFDILFAIKIIDELQLHEFKSLLHRIVSMLSRMTEPKKMPGQFCELVGDYDDEHEHDGRKQ